MDDPRAAEVLAQPGFSEFATEFVKAIGGNNLEYIFQRSHYMEFECGSSGGLPAPPKNCALQPEELVVPAIPYGIWNSDGSGYYSPEQYAEFVLDRFAAKAAPDAHVYAFGHHVRGATEGKEGVDVVVADVSPLRAGEPLFRPVVVFRVLAVEGVWSVVGLKIGQVEFVDAFFDWWVPCEVFPEAAGG